MTDFSQNALPYYLTGNISSPFRHICYPQIQEEEMIPMHGSRDI